MQHSYIQYSGGGSPAGPVGHAEAWQYPANGCDLHPSVPVVGTR
nr:hypothetical protein [Kibdelosporangium sp. MJ126-NF4]CTQ92654.1 hypothetical protein [Kibdelosporangium sp. MJ126-NF4]